MAEQLFSVNNFSPATYKALADNKVDKGQAFLSNNVTSAFTGERISLDMDVTEFVTEITAQVTNILAQEAAKEIGIYTARHATAIATLPKNILEQTTKTFNKEKKDFGDIIDSLRNPQKDVNAASEAQDNINNQTTEKVAEAKKQMNETVKKIKEGADEAVEKIKTVLQYISEGPDWIADQINKQLTAAQQHIHNKLELRWQETDKPFYDNFAETQGKALGNIAATEYNNLLKQKAEKQINKTKSALSKTKTKAKTKIMNTALGIAAKTGLI